MRKKLIEGIAPKKTKKKGQVVTAQKLPDTLIVNCFSNGKFIGRQCFDRETGRYMQYDAATGTWNSRMMYRLYSDSDYWDANWVYEKIRMATPEDAGIIDRVLRPEKYLMKSSSGENTRIILEAERHYRWDMAQRAYNSKAERIKSLSEAVPKLIPGFTEWADSVMYPDTGYLFYDKADDGYWCGNCESRFGSSAIGRVKDGMTAVCPVCGRSATVARRKKSDTRTARVMVLQKVNDDYSVARHLKIEKYQAYGSRIIIREDQVRVFLPRKPKLKTKILYAQYDNDDWWTGNPKNRRMLRCYLYPSGVAEALAGTPYEPWGRVFPAMAADGYVTDYNTLMRFTYETADMAELLYKGRFYRLLDETARHLSIIWSAYGGPLKLGAGSPEEAFGIKDRQKINFIRDNDGGEDMLGWIQAIDRAGGKIDRDAIAGLASAGIRPGRVKAMGILAEMSATQVWNYISRQHRESYPDRTLSEVLEQWGDYLDMCRKEGKAMTDEMVYRPRELRRRHDEIVEQIQQRKIIDSLRNNRYSLEKEAAGMRKRFPEAEGILDEIRERYEYEDDTYRITVPHTLMEIMLEGNALHHCVASTDRYFERIENRETYIFFLRKKSEPDIPYYTVEAEPGMAIRQHRSYMDEEPNIDQIRPFLKEWQQAVRKRLTDKDREYGRLSEVMRDENIQELRKANNTRVLMGLMEDFMEAI